MKLIRWAVALIAAALLVACGGDGKPNGFDKPKAKTTMLVYMVASNLYHLAERDLQEMQEAASSKDINVVVQVGGGTDVGTTDGMNLKETVRYRLVPASAPVNGKGWSLERLPNAEQPAATTPMNTTEALRDFIQWGAANYPAQQYSLTLWNHGGGPLWGYGQDDSFGGGKTMSVAQIVSALKQANIKMELIGFNACLMSSLEVAAALQPYANYMLASEEVTYGWTWPEVIQFMADNPSAKGDALGKAILDAYKEKRSNWEEFTAYAVTDLKQVPALVAAIENATSSLQQSLQSGGLSTWVQIAAARRNAEDFQTNVFSTGYDLVDVMSWVNELGNRNLLDASLLKTIQTAFDRAVIYSDGGEDQAYGLMMYFPRYSTSSKYILGEYSQLDFSPTVKDLVSKYAAFTSSAQIPQITVASPELNGNTFSAQVSSNMPALGRAFDRGYAVLVQNGAALAMQELGVNGNNILFPQAQVWPHLNGKVITALPEDDDDDIYLIPVKMLHGSEISDGTLYALKDEKGQLVVRYKVVQSAAAGSAVGMLKIAEGEEFHPLIMDASGTLVDSGVQLFAPAGDWVVEMKNLQGSGYQIYAAATDLVGSLKVSATPVNLN